MSGTGWILFWWLAFAISHMALAEGRRLLISKAGKLPYMLLYNAIALATFIPIVLVYLDNRHAGGLLWTAPVWLQQLGMVLALLGITLVLPSVIRSSPVGMIPGIAPQAQGLTRITRHPLFMGFALWGLGHCLIYGFVTDLLFFGGFALFSLIGAMHQDSRKQRQESERLAGFYAETSLLPFGAILSGRNSLVLGELPWLTLGLGATMAAGLYLLHPLMFG